MSANRRACLSILASDWLTGISTWLCRYNHDFMMVVIATSLCPLLSFRANSHIFRANSQILCGLVWLRVDVSYKYVKMTLPHGLIPNVSSHWLKVDVSWALIG